ncbi:PfkB family carbohydrate kinase [Oceanobacillus sp. FSL W7-1293]|uniref:carbohydrate kinase family protein n=1 Tax=Oceanobacillus sp. FSL W7-1293 TaxID=2921699 RepID=UPI0030D1EEF1
MSILCIGQAVYDITFPVDTPIVENQKYRIPQRIECMGGPAANAAYLCALWGSRTSLISRIGNDLFGKKILEQLESAGVDASSLKVDDQLATSISSIIVNQENGHRTILNTPLPPENYEPDWPDHSPNVVLMDGYEKECALQAFQKYPTAITLMDAGTFKPELLDIIEAVDYLVCSKDFAYQYSGIAIDMNHKETWRDTFSKLEKINPNTIVVTLGSDGAMYKKEDTIYYIPAFRADTVDTTGAGDIFHGAFAYCLENHFSLKDTVRIASLAASISVETLGGQLSIPSLESVRNKRDELGLEMDI